MPWRRMKGPGRQRFLKPGVYYMAKFSPVRFLRKPMAGNTVGVWIQLSNMLLTRPHRPYPIKEFSCIDVTPSR